MSDAQAAIKTLQDFDLMGRPIYLREDRLAPQATPSMPGPMGRGGGTNCKVSYTFYRRALYLVLDKAPLAPFDCVLVFVWC